MIFFEQFFRVLLAIMEMDEIWAFLATVRSSLHSSFGQHGKTSENGIGRFTTPPTRQTSIKNVKSMERPR